jgi:hypothetical protein
MVDEIIEGLPVWLSYTIQEGRYTIKLDMDAYRQARTHIERVLNLGKKIESGADPE